ncbi:hypothetical protein PFDSM3638_06280 [Pyrococcus furiosus DSM 3638]|uniref:Uncharacterized protein n=2 Tax=Pyrococcus furiosus (strain ATCC 43587 / DSM 3638 / JCM 8422 / Vc1) TaxID=186497 RepID=Q8U1E8_PYRFU|nr:hypothetical protein [Pyrococcus furiosus]AAL81384.1 hypothetical protein PF1260 [Pyrococcus furiosus DSM 3638]QEK78902.1 hypothetical protein PFDSM3638_06280 [Pyrococcus furiosus DSM 3638]
MRSFRFGPGIICVKGDKNKILKKTKTTPLSLSEALAKSDELDTIIVLNTQEAILVKMYPWVALQNIIHYVEDAESKGIIILIRTPNPSKTSEIIKERLNGKLLDPIEAILNSSYNETILMLTRRPITRPIRIEDVEASLLLPYNFHRVYGSIILEIPLILMETLTEWKEIIIKVYDTARKYRENIERLIIAVEDLDLGFIVGEGWDWDYPRPLLKVPVYKLKLFTWEDPRRIKFLLKGLEYVGYRRLCDIDVIVENKKIEWIELGKFRSKFDLASRAREELERSLSEEALEKIKSIEEKLLSKG